MKFSGNKWLPFILTVVVIILLNAAMSTVPVRVDLTRNRAYSLSEASKKAVSTLREPFTIKAFLSETLSPPHNNTEQILRDLLEEYALAGNRFFNYSIVTIPSRDRPEGGKGAEAEDEARKYRIYPVQIQTIDQDEVKLQSVYMGIALIHGDMIETIPALTNTSNLEYQITSLINQMGQKISALLSMTESIQVTLYLSKNMNELGSAFEEIPEQLQAAVAELNTQYYGKLNFDFRDPIAAGEEDLLESRYGLTPMTLRRRTNDGGQTSEAGYAMLVISHGDRRYATELMSRGMFGWQLQDVSALKQTIEDVTESIIGTNKEIGFASGYGIPSLDRQSESEFPVTSLTPDLSNFNALMSREYALKKISFPGDKIPEGLSCLIVAGPTAKLSDYDLYQIDQFLMKGGSLALFLDSHSVFMPQSNQFAQAQEPAYIPRNTGLEQMLAHYGVNLKQAYVLDERSYTQRQRTAGGSIVETPIYYAPMISEERISNELEIFRNIPEMIMLYNAPLELNENLPPNARAIPLISSSSNSWLMEQNINLAYPQSLEPPPPDMQSPSVLAYLLEGEFESYFAGKDVPEPPEPEAGESADLPPGAEAEQQERTIVGDEVAVERQVRERGAGRIFVIGSSVILGSNILDAEGRTGNSLFFINLFDYLNDREDYAIMRTKGVNYVPIREGISAQAKSFIRSFNIAVLPALVVGAGILVWVGRIRRKKRLEYYFLRGGKHGE